MTIAVLPLVLHCVVFGPVSTQRGGMAAAGAGASKRLNASERAASEKRIDFGP